MFVVYILKSTERRKTYTGYTNDLTRRLHEHNAGRVPFTRRFHPWRVIYTETVGDEQEAKKRERYWKSGAGRRNIRRVLNGEQPSFR